MKSNDATIDKKKYLEEHRDELLRMRTITNAFMLNKGETVFMAAPIMQAPFSFKDNLPMLTMGTDGKNIYADPVFYKEVADSVDKRLWATCHEGLHILFGHCDKGRSNVRTEGDHRLFNIAGDIVINSMLRVSNIGKQIKGTITANSNGDVKTTINNKEIRFDAAHTLGVRDVYEMLKQHVQSNPPPPGSQGTMTVSQDGQDVSEFDDMRPKEFSADEKEEVKDGLRRMLNEGRLKGNLPGWMEKQLEGMLKNKVNWKAELREFISPEIKQYTKFTKPNRRYASLAPTILPGWIKEGVNVVIAIDTSGSISKEECEFFLGQINGLFKSFDKGAVKATIYLHHTEVYQQLKAEDTKTLAKLRWKSGGTDHHDVFEQAEKAKARLLVCLTDGYSSFPSRTNVSRVLWLCINKAGAEMIPKHLAHRVLILEKSDLKEV